MLRKIAVATIGLSALALAACGSGTTDRALSGAGIGGAAGLVGGALVGAPVEGALIGGAAGAGAGALIDQKDLDLGTPIWR